MSDTSLPPPEVKKPKRKRSRKVGRGAHLQELLGHFLASPTSHHHMTQLVWALVDYELHARLKAISQQDTTEKMQIEDKEEDFPFPADGCVLESIQISEPPLSGSASHG